jgi:ABC-2 type transport system ATP-binding protein
MSPPVVSVSRISKHFDSVTAVEDISFEVAPRSTTALLGGNGAGKTTTLSMLLGLLLPSSGAISIFGVDILRDRYRVLPRLNFSSPYVDLPRRLTVRENLTVYARLYGIVDIKGRIAALSEDLQIGRFLGRPYGQLSAGEKTRVMLAKALLNEPELMLLDEPTASLDPDTADYVRGMLEAYRRRSGTTILLASHNMSEVERLCDDVIMLRAGRIVDRGTPEQLLTRYGRQNMEEVFIDIARERRLELAPGSKQVLKQ